MAPRVLRYACTRCTHLPGFDRLASRSKIARKQSLQYHIEREHPEVADWTVLAREIPRIDKRRSLPAAQVAILTNRVHKSGHKTPATTTIRPRIILKLKQRAICEAEETEEVRSTASDNDMVSVNMEKLSTISSNTFETMVRGSSQEGRNSNKAIATPTTHSSQTGMNTAWQTSVNREPSKTAELVRVPAPAIHFDIYAREALEGKYGPHAEAIAWRAFPYSNKNISTFESANADNAAIDAVRFLMWKNERIEAELETAQRQSEQLMKYVVADIDARLGTQPVSSDLITGMLRGQGMTDVWIEGNVGDIVSGLKEVRSAAVEATYTAD